MPEWVIPAAALFLTVIFTAGGNAILLAFYAGKFTSKFDAVESGQVEIRNHLITELARIEKSFEKDIREIKEAQKSQWKRIDELRDMLNP